MTKRVIRRVAIAHVFAAGIGAILATSWEPSYRFRELRVEPQQRCPGGDVEISWELNKFSPVKIMVGGKELMTATASGTTLPADLLDGGAPITNLVLDIEAEYNDYPEIHKITTFDIERTVTELASHVSGGEFKIDTHGVWDERIRVVRIRVKAPTLVCEGGVANPPAWEVSPPSGGPFLLNAETGYTSILDPAPPASGDWRLRPKGGNCYLPESDFERYLIAHLTAVCTNDPEPG